MADWSFLTNHARCDRCQILYETDSREQRQQQAPYSAARSYDEAAAARLWQVSADLTGQATAA